MSESIAVLKELVASITPPATLDEARRQMDSYPQPLPEGTAVEAVDVEGIAGEWLSRADSVAGRALLFLHGGGYTTGSIRSHRRLAALVAAACAADCLTIDYRLAPEHPCPAAVDDAVTAYQWLRASGASSIMIAGDSAGGGLALATLLALRKRGVVLPDAAVLLAPWLDLTCAGTSMTVNADADFILSADGLREAAQSYAGTRPLEDELVSPLFGDFAGLPPVFVQVGDADLVLDDALRFARRAGDSGSVVELEVAEGMPHVFQGFSGLLPEADRAIDRIGNWAQSILSP